MCARPYRQGVLEHGCGQCMSCRVNRARLWTSRLLLESYTHTRRCFVTLTYSDEHLPEDGSVSRRELQLFFKRLRDRVAPVRIRYFAVGEYGGRFGRPHYHAILFGIDDAHAVRASWELGHVDVRDLGIELMRYVTGYCMKRLNMDEGGKRAEFAVMSLRPGIGARAVSVLGEALTSYSGAKALARDRRVPGAVRSGKFLPIGRYIRGKLSEELGVDPQLKDQALQQYQAELWLQMQDAAFLAAREGRREREVAKAKTMVREKLERRTLQ